MTEEDRREAGSMAYRGVARKRPHERICGGCRARAYGYFADVQHPDPGCLKNQEYWQKIRKK